VNLSLWVKLKKNKTPNRIMHNNKSIENIEEISEAFNHLFGYITEKLFNLLPSVSKIFANFLNHPNKSSIFLEAPTSQEIFNLILNLNVKKSPRFDNISVYFLRIIALIILPYLAGLFSYA